jgi:ABC-type lipoprotein release transport system permease subunit
MTETIISSLLSLVGTLVGTFGGILVASKLTVYRIEQLEKKVEKHNSVVERTFKLEGEVVELQHEVRDLKEYHKP